MDGTRFRSRSVAALAVGAATLTALFGCSLTTSAPDAPTDAHIVVSGTSTPLQLTVSTDFYQVQDTVTAEIHEVYNSSQTITITPPYDQHWSIGSQARIAVHLKNTSASDVTVRMQIELDNGGQGYDHNSTLPSGQELAYVYIFNQSIF